MHVKRLGWLGVRTERFDEMVGIAPRRDGRLPEARGARAGDVHVGEWRPGGRVPYERGPIRDVHDGARRGIVVDDVELGARELAEAGVEVFDVQRGDGFMWAHFRGPDGNIYELQSTDPPG